MSSHPAPQHTEEQDMIPGKIEIAGRSIGAGQPAFVIAEVGQAHDGSLGNAYAYVDAVAESGADAIKFQTHIATAESTIDEPFRVKFSKQDDSRFAYWQRMEFTPEQWHGLAEHARERGLIFLSSPFSVAAVRLLASLGMPAWKIGSGEFRSSELLEAMLATGKPLLLSTGMATYAEIAAAVDLVGTRGGSLALLQCTTKYPTALPDVGLNVIDELKQRFRVPVGLSDHSGQLWPAVIATARQADLIEVHVVFDRRMFGPDTKASLTLDELSQLCDARDAAYEMDSQPVDKDAMAAELATMRDLFTKSVCVVEPLRAGTVLTAEMLTAKKPGTGIPAGELVSLIGRRLRQDVEPSRLLRYEDLDDQA